MPDTLTQTFSPEELEPRILKWLDEERLQGSREVGELFGLVPGGQCPQCKHTHVDLEETQIALVADLRPTHKEFGVQSVDVIRCRHCDARFTPKRIYKDLAGRGKRQKLLARFGDAYRPRLRLFSAFRRVDGKGSIEVVLADQDHEALKLLNCIGEVELEGCRILAEDEGAALQLVRTADAAPWFPLRSVRGKVEPTLWHPSPVAWELRRAETDTQHAVLIARAQVEREAMQWKDQRLQQLLEVQGLKK